MLPNERDAAYLWDMVDAAGRVSKEFQTAHSDIPWRGIIGQRNIQAHEYGDIKQERMWSVVVERIPELLAILEPLVPPVPKVD